MSNLPDQLRKLMRKYNLSESSLSRQVSIPQPVISRLLSGSTANPRASTLLALAKRFNVSIEALMGEQNLPDDVDMDDFAHLYLYDDADLLAKNTPTRMIVSHTRDKDAFAYEVSGNLMNPVINKGNHLIVCRNIVPQHNDFALYIQSGHVFLRQLVVLENNTLHAYIPSAPHICEPLNEDITLLGVVIEIHQKVRNIIKNKNF